MIINVGYVILQLIVVILVLMKIEILKTYANVNLGTMMMDLSLAKNVIPNVANVLDLHPIVLFVLMLLET